MLSGPWVDTEKPIEIDHLQAADGDPSSLITALLPAGHRRTSTLAGPVRSYVIACPWKSRLVLEATCRDRAIEPDPRLAAGPRNDEPVPPLRTWAAAAR